MLHGIVVSLTALSLAASGAELAERTAREFRRYVSSQETAMKSPRPHWNQLSPGQLRVEPWNGSPTVDVSDGLIHDWVAAYFAPGVRAESVHDVLANYSQYPKTYAPEVLRAEVLPPSGDEARLLMRMVKKKIITVVLDTEFQIESLQPSKGVFVSRSRSSRTWEVDDVGKPSETRLAPGTGFGFLWALNSYWYIEDRDGGAYVECRAISLTRDIPTGLGWAIKPMITSLPKESLEKTLRDTVQAATR